ncbi:MAG TPA: GGDEF domain-containing protein [Myxococcota bacterium]|jgi:diguanylate cyclase (GGDEF)-like protein
MLDPNARAQTQGFGAGLRRRLASLLSWPLRSLPSRIVTSVFSAALITSLVVSFISTRSIESFLREKIDEKFPALLHGTRQRLDLYYAQRQLDVETFARSAVVTASCAGLAGPRASASRAELRTYLSYVLERFPQYEALFVLDRQGRTLLWIGDELALPAALRERAARISAPTLGGIERVGERRVQLASAPVQDARDQRIASLHALVQVGAVEQLLVAEDAGQNLEIFVAGGDGATLLTGPDGRRRHPYGRVLPPASAAPVVEDYSDPDGVHRVGSAVQFERFGWTIVVEQPYDDAFAPAVSTVREQMLLNLGIVLGFSLVAFQLARSIARPILALSDAARRIATGETDVLVAGSAGVDEIGVLTRAFNEMSGRLRRNQLALEESRLEVEDANARLVAQNNELQRVNEVFQQLSITDDLTKLHNHRFFHEHLPREMKRAVRTGEPLALVVIDLDDFKRLNDRFGHAVGDAVLHQVAVVMSGVVREMDLLARYGGEEFALLASRTSLDGAVALAEKIRLAISQARFSVMNVDGPIQIQVTASLGVAPFRGDEKAFFNDADRALYRAKALGKDCVVVADSGE